MNRCLNVNYRGLTPCTENRTKSGYITCSGELVESRCEYEDDCGKTSIDTEQEKWSSSLHTELNIDIPDQLNGVTDLSWWGITDFGEAECRTKCADYCEGKNLFPEPPDLVKPYNFGCESEKGKYGY